ncbi:MAG: YrdB family protein [Bacilli bacterium]
MVLSAIRFCYEILLVVVSCMIGFRMGNTLPLKWITSIALGGVVVYIWANFGAPKSPTVLSKEAKLLLEVVISAVVIGLCFYQGRTSLGGFILLSGAILSIYFFLK